MVPLDCRLCRPQFLLLNICLDLEVRQFFAQSLCRNPQIFSLLFTNLDLLVQHDRPLNSDIVF